RIRTTWVLTVGWARKSRCPISVLLWTWAMSTSTSRSRGVSISRRRTAASSSRFGGGSAAASDVEPPVSAGQESVPAGESCPPPAPPGGRTAPRRGGSSLSSRRWVDDGADRVEQHLGQGVLEEEPGGAAPQGVQGVLIIVEGGQDDDLRGADLPAVGEAEDLLGRFDPVDAGHAHVHEDDIGLLLADGVDAGHAIAGLTGHGHIGLGVDDHGEASAHKGLVVDEDDTQRIRRMSAHRRPPVSPLRVLGPEVVVGLSTSPSTAAGPASCPAPSLSSLPSSRPSSWPRAPVP